MAALISIPNPPIIIFFFNISLTPISWDPLLMVDPTFFPDPIFLSAPHRETRARTELHRRIPRRRKIFRRELMPGHVAMILDGNRRWAELKGHGPEMGHDAGVHVLLEVMGLCCKWGIKVATFFLFSSENWRRPKEEIDFVMRRFERMLVDELENFMRIIRQGIRITTIGNTTLLMNSLQQVLDHTKEATKDNTRTQVIFAISYSGQDDITQACQRIATKFRDGLIEPIDITNALIEQELETRITSIPSPDLLIRTSGEIRISNFLLWQLAYSELYFTDALWPDFGEAEFIQALHSFQKRRRRFGGR